jgi:hypothetical protein
VVGQARVHFSIGNCEYNGSLRAPSGRLEGVLDCRNTFNGQVVEAHGTWVAER